MATTTGFGRATQYHRLYTAMRGVDTAGDGGQIDASRFAHLENMYRDYDGEGAYLTESVVGFRRLFRLPKRIRSLFRQRTADADHLLVHAGDGLYRVPMEQRDDPLALVRIGDLADAPSAGFPFEDRFFILDGTSLTEVTRDGTCHRVGDGASPYVPILYENGEALEQRNILTDRFLEHYTVGVPEQLTYGTPGLRYEEDPDDVRTVRVTGMGDATGTVIYVPSRVELGGVEYPVSGIAPQAFAGTALTEVHVGCGVSYVGAHAFFRCTALRTVVLHDRVRSIGEHAFDGCTTLADVYLGTDLCEVGESAFNGCPTSMLLHYASSDYRFTLIEGKEELMPYPMHMSYPRHDIPLRIPVYSIAEAIDAVRIHGQVYDATPITEDGHIVAVCIHHPDRYALFGAVVSVEGTLRRTGERAVGGTHAFLDAYPSYEGPCAEIITGCTLCAAFDGRIFLSGNPRLPGAVFYSHRTRTGAMDPTYFGVYNYLLDGVGHAPVTSLLATADALVVFKAEDDGAGSIFYHTPATTDTPLVPRIYPVAYTHTGVGALGASLTFLDDPVFIGTGGLMALDRRNLSEMRSIAVRSHAIAEQLLCEDASRIRLTVWCGYLVLSVDGRMYLADSRQTYRHATGAMQYEWYPLAGIGTYEGDVPVYRYATDAPEGFTACDTPDERVTGQVLSSGGILYTEEGGKRIAVYLTEERTGGTFYPATALLGSESLLFFGTDAGTVCLFNNDMRGVAPRHIREADDFDAEAYAAREGRRIHPTFYDFDGHAPRYALSTLRDCGGIPHLRKHTVPHSLTVKCRSTLGSSLHVEVLTDRVGRRYLTDIPTSPLSFHDVDFGAFTFSCDDTFTVPLRERERGWVEKQISVFSDKFRSPIGVYSIAYRFTVDGRLRRD